MTVKVKKHDHLVMEKFQNYEKLCVIQIGK